MIDALIAGRLYAKPQRRTDKAGKPYTVARVRVLAPTGENLVFHCVCFTEEIASRLLALNEGDGLAVSGDLKVGTFQGKDGTWRPSLDMVVHGLLTNYEVACRREAMVERQEAHA
jgi:single-stranded DNA-binding protein